ncbi:MAG: PIN domain-containing protein [Alphaproteobacteria bacterium]|nr:MAG: PIN domain-containing protein [Alphaproteobacteria bacterium]
MKPFLDTNVLVYAVLSDDPRRPTAGRLLAAGGTISVQVLNEFANVARGKLLARDHGLAFYDALIVAAALEAGCDTLFTEDMQHGRKFGSLTIINPFI